ncbi:ATP-binding protein [Candidatus Woesearchaeota archaeon]|nr:ATP-binding protein [Candidatus Woesearchaeota archaeon]
MDKHQIIELLLDWNFWKKELEAGMPRHGYLKQCHSLLKSNVIVTITGIRRSGKSYILRQLMQDLIKNGTLPKNILMVNFEDVRFSFYSPRLLEEIYTTYLETLAPDKKPLIILDEVHKIPQWERWVRTIHELGKASIIVSGSSSHLLKGELATVLTGRHLDLTVFPFSFSEFLSCKGVNHAEKLDIFAKRTIIRTFLQEYMEFGGFPEVVFAQESEQKKKLLMTGIEDVLYKDIGERYEVRDSTALQVLCRYYLSNIGGRITFNALSKSLQKNIITLQRYTEAMEEAYLVFFIRRFSFKVKEQENAARKLYAADVGLANAFGFKFSENIGKLVETLIAIHLRKKALDQRIELFYWQSQEQQEVDFVLKKGNKVVQLIQSCWKLDDEKTKQRELRALVKAGDALVCKDLLVITEDHSGEETFSWYGTTGSIRYIPLWQWLLDEHSMFEEN